MYVDLGYGILRPNFSEVRSSLNEIPRRLREKVSSAVYFAVLGRGSQLMARTFSHGSNSMRAVCIDFIHIYIYRPHTYIHRIQRKAQLHADGCDVDIYRLFSACDNDSITYICSVWLVKQTESQKTTVIKLTIVNQKAQCIGSTVFRRLRRLPNVSV